jgi:hypothetical protein
VIQVAFTSGHHLVLLSHIGSCAVIGLVAGYVQKARLLEKDRLLTRKNNARRYNPIVPLPEHLTRIQDTLSSDFVFGIYPHVGRNLIDVTQLEFSAQQAPDFLLPFLLPQ